MSENMKNGMPIKHRSGCENGCCLHVFRGPIWMVVPDGHIVMQCCKCQCTKTVHAEHAHEHKRTRSGGPSWQAGVS